MCYSVLGLRHEEQLALKADDCVSISVFLKACEQLASCCNVCFAELLDLILPSRSFCPFPENPGREVETKSSLQNENVHPLGKMKTLYFLGCLPVAFSCCLCTNTNFRVTWWWVKHCVFMVMKGWYGIIVCVDSGALYNKMWCFLSRSSVGKH